MGMRLIVPDFGCAQPPDPGLRKMDANFFFSTVVNE
jgi:hypothetical protein